MIKLSYKKKIFSYFFLVFLVFTISILLYEQEREKALLKNSLEQRLNDYVEMAHNYVKGPEREREYEHAAELASLLPNKARISIISLSGDLIYDNKLQNINHTENHLQRPEIKKATKELVGSNIRLSKTTGVKYLYYARRFDDCFIRVALPYISRVENLLSPSPGFLFFVAILFLLVMFLFLIVSEKIGKSISNLKLFTTAIKNEQPLPQNISFPKDELGQMGSELMEIFNQKEQNKQKIEQEKEKLLRHMRFSENGIAIYSPQKESTYFNSYFILFAKQISKKTIIHADDIFKLPEFQAINKFLENRKLSKKHFSYEIEGNGKALHVHTVVYTDESFEVVIRDITKQHKNQKIKQEITNNIAHELRTPVTSIRGYLETLIYNGKLTAEKQMLFIEKAYKQSIRLSNLIDDVSLLSKIGESSGNFNFENLDIVSIIDETKTAFAERIALNKTKIFVDIEKGTKVEGNRTLLQSIFSNLIDNSLKYAGEGAEIHISKYMEDSKFISISLYDTGIGVEEKHLNRLFERFYRVNEGRSSETGGTGLGLAIVRNAIHAHKGVVQVKNRENAGLEFLFTLQKKR